MTEQQGEAGRIHIDSDWKEEAAREKEIMAEQERQAEAKKTDSGDATAGSAPPFIELVNLMAMQAMYALGGMQGPSGENIPPNPHAAKHHIDLLEVLSIKTKGNLTDDEQKALDAVLYELRMVYVQMTTGEVPPGGPTPEGAPPA